MKNQIQVISPYRLHGTWVFDDPSVGLVQEPFVNGVPEMIDSLVAGIPEAHRGFRLLFSAAPFPGFQRKLSWVRQEMDGNWYWIDDPPAEGWLCPALLRFFTEAPAELFVKAEAIKPDPALCQDGRVAAGEFHKPQSSGSQKPQGGELT